MLPPLKYWSAAKLPVVDASAFLDYLLRTPRVEEVESRFGALPFRVDVDGVLDFGPPCGAFGPDGGSRPQGAKADTPKYEPEGFYWSEPLDSRLYRCQWHRVILRGTVPTGCSVRVRTYTAEVPLPFGAIQGLAADEWHTHQVARHVRGEWDCLVRGSGGRYLWLELRLGGNTRVTPCLESVDIEFPRISLRRCTPAATTRSRGWRAWAGIRTRRPPVRRAVRR